MNDLSRLLRHHRSIRHYLPTPIDPALVTEVCEDAIAGGSSSGNLNGISIVLTRDPERKRRLYELHLEQPMVLEAPLVVTFCADWYRTRTWLRRRGARDNFNNLLGYHVAAYDAMIVAQNACLGFQARGLGICYMGTTLYSLAELVDFLQLPETVVPVTSIVVGYPAEDPAKRDRLPVTALVHDEVYRRPTEAVIDTIYAERERRGWQRYMSIPEIKAAIEAAGITSLAQYYTSKIKYDPDFFGPKSEEIRALLERQGFWN
ncbi:MAG TPA: nitroreductase family protein [Burkholderiaceae bacterium]|nr:nitroreductase family protein [Burkholderiaceae bacterium]